MTKDMQCRSYIDFVSSSSYKQISNVTRGSTMHDSHFDSFVPTTTDNLIRHKINTIDFICVARKVRFDLICLEVPDLETSG